MLAPSAILSTNLGLCRAKAPPFCLFLFFAFFAACRAIIPGRKPPPRCLFLLVTRRSTLRGMMIVRRHRSVFFLLSYSAYPFLSHVTIDSFSVLTRDPIPRIFEFGSQTLDECFLGSFVFDKQTCNLGGTFSSTESRQESPFLTFSSSSDRSFLSCSFGRHDGK